jgi:pyruvate/2-oxoglutarate dehydrogenase complex dihydrolipoamide dehydrogenase (E3) component
MSVKSDLFVIGCDPVGFEIAFAAAGLGARVRMAGQDLPPTASQRARLGAVGVTFVDQPVRMADKSRLIAGQETMATRWIVIANGTERTHFPLEIGKGKRCLVIGRDGEAVQRALQAAHEHPSVTLVSPGALLPDFEPEMVDQLRLALQARGIDIIETEAMPRADEATGRLELGGGASLAAGDLRDIIDTTPGSARLAGLGLETLRLRNLIPDRGLRLPGAPVFIVGEALGALSAKPSERNQIGLVLGSALYGKNTRLDPEFDTRFVASRPGLAEFGVLPGQIPDGKRDRFRLLRAHRSAGTGRPAASLLIVVDRRARILGASAFGDRAPELITPLLVLARQKAPLTELAAFSLSGHGEDDLLAQVSRQPLVDKLRSPAARRLLQWRRLFG